jgi:hypothetical protein
MASCSAVRSGLVSVLSAFERISIGRPAITSAIGNDPNYRAIIVSGVGVLRIMKRAIAAKHATATKTLICPQIIPQLSAASSQWQCPIGRGTSAPCAGQTKKILHREVCGENCARWKRAAREIEFFPSSVAEPIARRVQAGREGPRASTWRRRA